MKNERKSFLEKIKQNKNSNTDQSPSHKDTGTFITRH